MIRREKEESRIIPVIQIDKINDTAYATVSPWSTEHSIEVMQGVIFDYDSTGKICGVEILRFGDRLPLIPTSPEIPGIHHVRSLEVEPGLVVGNKRVFLEKQIRTNPFLTQTIVRGD